MDTLHTDSKWYDHARKRVKLTLGEELAQTQLDTQRKLFAGGKGNLTDTTVWCGGRSWNVHAAIVGSRCPFFKACWEDNFKESNSKTVYLDDDNADAVDVFLEYLYTLSSDTLTHFMVGKKNPVEHLIPLIRLADKYDQPLLLEQIYMAIKIYGLEAGDLLRALAGVDQNIGTSIWINRIQELILDLLTKVGTLNKVSTEVAGLLQKYPRATCRLIEAMSKKLKVQGNCIDIEDSDGVDSDQAFDDYLPLRR